MKKGYRYIIRRIGMLPVLLICFIGNVYADNSFKTPDFAFPQDVENNALTVLKQASSKEEWCNTINAAIQLTIARDAISNSNAVSQAYMLDSLARTSPTPYSNLFYLLEARLFTDIYNSNSWNYDNRVLPLDSFPSNPSDWSKDLFAKKVKDLIESSQDNHAELATIPLSAISEVLSNAKDAINSGFTIEDFIVEQDCRLLNSFVSGSSDILPFKKSLVKQSITSQCKTYLEELSSRRCNYALRSGTPLAKARAILANAEYMPNDKIPVYLYDSLKNIPDDGKALIYIRLFEVFYRNWSYERNYNSSSSSSSLPDVTDFYKSLKDYIKNNPANPYLAGVVNAVRDLEAPSYNCGFSRQWLSDSQISDSISISNINKLSMLMVKMPNRYSRTKPTFSSVLKNGKVVAVQDISVDNVIPFNAKIEINFGKLEPGVYTILPSTDNTLSGVFSTVKTDNSLPVLLVSDITLANTNGKKDMNRVYVADAHNFAPMVNCQVNIYDNSWKNRGKLVSSLKTDKNGSVRIPDGNYLVEAVSGNNLVNSKFYFYSPGDEKHELIKNIKLFTDLSIYHPGDSVNFAIISYSAKQTSYKVLPDEKIDVVLRNANYEVVDSLTLVTDKSGRASGVFHIPDAGLLGYWALDASFNDPSKSTYSGHAGFQVSDYKSPTFRVILDAGSDNIRLGDNVKIRGKVMTYAGLPLPGVDVSYNVTYSSPWWLWRGAGSSASFGESLTCDANGEFIIELPTDSLRNTPYQSGMFNVTATAVSPAGESQTSTPFRFCLGETAQVDINNFPAILAVDDKNHKPVDVNIPVYNSMRSPVKNIDVEWSAYDSMTGAEVAFGSFRSPEFDFDFASLPSGRYNFTFFPHDYPDSKVTKDLIIYRNNDKTVPYPTPLWVPEKIIMCPADRNFVEIIVGSSFKNSSILCLIASTDGSCEVRRFDINGTVEHIKIPVKTGMNKTKVTFLGMHDLKGMTETVEIIPQEVTKSLQVETITFRDKMVPGDKEIWKFRFVGKTGSDSEGIGLSGDIYALSVLSNAALNAIAPFSWSFSPRQEINWSYPVYAILNSPNYVRFSNSLSNVRYDKVKYFTSPEWNFYNRSLYSTSESGYRNVFLGSRIGEGGNSTVKIRGYNTVEYAAQKQEMKMADTVMLTGAIEEEASTDSGSADGAIGQNKDEVRPVEMPLAFFKPDLTAEDGVVSIEFEVPNFNTTWQFQLLGYDPDMYSSSIVLNTIAAKKVIVQSNAPRYLRTGDVTTLSATLFNNSASEIPIGGRIELFNPLTEEIIVSKDFSAEMIMPSGNRTVSLEYSVPDDYNLLGLRTFAVTDRYSDGESSIIEILPASQPIIESHPFYIGADNHFYNLQLPGFSRDAKVTFQYCDNPVWYCATALPAISIPVSSNAIAISDALFGNAAGFGLVAKFPEIREALVDVSGDSLLISNLEKNSELKTFGLANTPWVNNAQSETLRMASLHQYLDSSTGEKNINSLIEDLAKLQNKDGGWSWCPAMPSSRYITSSVVNRLAMLEKMGFLPKSDKLQMMISAALTYCEGEIMKEYNRSPSKFDFDSLLDFLYEESFFPSQKHVITFESVKIKAISAIKKNWKSMDIFDKSTAAILLYRSGDSETSKLILKSLVQYSSRSESQGVWFDNLSSGFNGYPRLMITSRALEAFNEVSPDSAIIDGLRQWLLLSRQTEDWGENKFTSEVIYAILSSGTDWMVSSRPAQILINGSPLNVSERERLTGSFSISLDAAKVSGGKIEISRESASPAWGGVISQLVAPIKSVKRESVPELYVTKEIYLLKDTSQGTIAEKVSSFNVGDKVRVTLTIHSGRDMDYVALNDERSACMEPKNQTSGYTVNDGLWFYREVRNTSTNLFFNFLPKGNHVISYECYIDRAGEYSLGVATIQSLYAPLMTAHSAGDLLIVSE